MMWNAEMGSAIGLVLISVARLAAWGLVIVAVVVGSSIPRAGTAAGDGAWPERVYGRPPSSTARTWCVGTGGLRA